MIFPRLTVEMLVFAAKRFNQTSSSSRMSLSVSAKKKQHFFILHQQQQQHTRAKQYISKALSETTLRQGTYLQLACKCTQMKLPEKSATPSKATKNKPAPTS
jgi:hypothetical protein